MKIGESFMILDLGRMTAMGEAGEATRRRKYRDEGHNRMGMGSHCGAGSVEEGLSQDKQTKSGVHNLMQTIFSEGQKCM
jgi:hypothetical protein